MLVAFNTLGCKVNSYETEAAIELFERNGFTVVDFNQHADVYIINTCMVTNTGERKSKKIIRRPYQINPSAIVIAMGCLTQLKAEEILQIEGVKIVLGTKNRDKILDYLNEYMSTKQKLNKVEPLDVKERYDPLIIRDFKHHKRAFLKIQDGCNNFCSYCIIPYTRGRIRSKPKAVVLQEARTLVKSGHIEIVLTGIHTVGYGEDLKQYSFGELLEDLEMVDGLIRIRISSIEITELTDHVVDIISRSKKIVNHIHIPLQSGSNQILQSMNRKYTTEEFYQIILNLKQHIPGLAITTDVIVGFPGETEEQFKEQYEFIQKVDFQELHVFPFSRREGTIAAKMNGQIDNSIKKERVHRLLELSTALKTKHIEQQIGQTHYVIPEQIKGEYLQGHTRDYLLVCIKADSSYIGQEVGVVITSYDKECCYGKVLS